MKLIDEEMGMEEYCCRICYEETCDRHDVVVPCLCSGSCKYICKECLQDWRANGSTARSFTHCPTCDFEYHLESNGPVDQFLQGTICGCLPATWFGRYNFFRYLVFSDFFVGFFIINAYLVQFGIFIRWIDSHEFLVHLMPWDDVQKHDESEHLFKAFRHHKATYYATSLIITLTLVLIMICYQYYFTCQAPVSKLRRSILWNNRKLNRGKLVAILILFVILKFVLGAFIALLSIVAWMQKSATRHVAVLEKKEIAKEFQVVDLELAGRLKYKQNLGSSASVSASDPPKSHHLASSNLLDRLLKNKIS